MQIPAFNVPETGIVDYQERSVPTQLTEGKWLRATAWANATPTVHHALAGWIPKVDPNGRGFSWNVALGGYGPGGAPNLTPSDTGIFLPPGGSYAYQMHYTPIGKPVTDTTEVGYYFYKEEPKYILRQASITDFSIEIPAGEQRHQETAYLEFPHDAEVFGVQPHCHSRCYSTKLRIRYPDGTEKVLLNQPRYYFSWQREYHFQDLLEVPKGSLLIADYVYRQLDGERREPGSAQARDVRRADLRGDAVHVRALPLQGRDGRRAPRRVVPASCSRTSRSARWTTTSTAS